MDPALDASWVFQKMGEVVKKARDQVRRVEAVVWRAL